ncbi:MAG: TetR/AcrR family transcriptional regulator [Deltaproteobacteria bacterium]|nr:TetR/AcrR family transcriptional regulator [Deltaproteobacteria bacterium]
MTAAASPPSSSPPPSAPRASRRTSNVRTGGRSERVVRDVLRAAMDELSRAGYGPMRVDDVAAKAGVNKTTVYRRWPTKADLVIAAVKRMARHERAAPDTGSLRGDLLAMLTQAREVAMQPEVRAAARIVSEARDNAELEPIARVLRHNAAASRAVIVERAKARGELGAEVDGALLLDALVMPVTMRIARYGEEVGLDQVEALVDLVLYGALAKPLR